MKTQVGILGAGPAGLLLARLLHNAGIACTVLETRSRAHVESRIRAGVLEAPSVALLRQAGVATRMDREGLAHHGVKLHFNGQTHRIDLHALTGQTIMVYGQHEVVRDLIAANLAAGVPILFEATATALHSLTTTPAITYTHNGETHDLTCDFIAGCDGFHGIARPAIPDLAGFDRIYPFGWLGILAEAPPASEELIYASHENGFALLSMRSPTISRLYLQVAPDENADAWSADRIWSELRLRLGNTVTEGPILQKSVTAMRSYVAEPMQHGRLFLAGDAAHIVPPTGAKGMNLAFGDIALLARGLQDFYHHHQPQTLETYSQTALQRVWKAERFSWWLTSLLHRFETHSPFERRMQTAELAYLTTSQAAATTLAENYVGLPFA